MNNEFGRTIRIARGEKSLRKFSEEIGITHTHLDALERGCDPRTGKPVNISVSVLKKLSDATGIEVERLVAMIEGNTVAIDTPFSRRIRLVRLQMGLTQEEFGSLLGKTGSTIRSWELGASMPTCEGLILISKQIGKSSDYLLGINETKYTRDVPASPYPDGDKSILACPNCGSGEYLHNSDENENAFCGQCGQAIKWEVADNEQSASIL